MNDFIEVAAPCTLMSSILIMTFSFVIFMRFIHQKEQAVLAQYNLKNSSAPRQSAVVIAPVVAPLKAASRSTNHVQEPNKPLSNKNIQAQVDKALRYKKQISRLTQHPVNTEASQRLKSLVRQVDEWVKAIKQLALRVDNFQQDTLIRQDLESVPQAIQRLEKRLSQESDEQNRAELEQMLLNLQKQNSSLEQLDHIVKRAEIQIESTLSSLGTIYTQMLTGQSASHVANYNSLATNVDEEVHRLQDHLEALQEVKLGRLGV